MFDLVYPASPAVVLPKPTADKPADRPAPGTEMLPVIDENGIVYAQASRAWCHGGSMLLHPVVHLHILNRYDQLYLQKRSMKKGPASGQMGYGGRRTYRLWGICQRGIVQGIRRRTEIH